MKKSHFDGTVLELIGVSILSVFLTIITFGFGLAWAFCIEQEWITSHTTIDGKRLHFVGKGWDLFKNLVVWILLTIVTIGIFAFWIPIKQQQWIAENTHFVGECGDCDESGEKTEC